MFVDLYFPPGLLLDRDEIHEAIEASPQGDAEVVGAGTGVSGSNLDLELMPTIDLIHALRQLEEVLSRLRVPDGTLIVTSEPVERISLADLRLRLARSE